MDELDVTAMYSPRVPITPCPRCGGTGMRIVSRGQETRHVLVHDGCGDIAVAAGMVNDTDGVDRMVFRPIKEESSGDHAEG